MIFGGILTKTDKFYQIKIEEELIMSKCTAPVRGHRTASAAAATIVTAPTETVVVITLEYLVIRQIIAGVN